MKNELVNFVHSYNNGFNIKFNPTTRPLKSWYTEVYNTANEIYKSNTKPIYVCFSGGIDSEVIVKAFMENKIPFTVFIVKHINQTNNHDIHFAINFCKQNNLKYIICPFNAENFFKKKVFEYAEKGFRAIRIFRYFQLFIMEQIERLDGCAVLGSGEQVYCNINGEICINMEQGHTMSLDWCEVNKTKHYPYYFMQNSELYASYMKVDLIEHLLKNPSYFTNYLDNMSTEKIIVYHRFWPELKRRDKYHGFESIMPIKNETEMKLRDMFPDIVPKFFPIKTIKQQLGLNE